MDSRDLEILDLLTGLSAPEGRLEAARALALRAGARQMLLFVRDPEVGVLLPAPGFPQTLDGGPTWRRFLAACTAVGRFEAQVEFPRGTQTTAMALVPDGLAAVFIGGRPEGDAFALFERLMPLLSHALHAEQHARFATESAEDARGAASRARSLADALEVARAQHADLNARLHDEHRRKDDFLAMLAHELRNPLTPLVTSIELIRRAGGSASERHLDIMSRQVRHLSRLVEDLLDVSRVSRGRIDLRRHHLRLAEFVQEALEASRAFLDSRRHRVEVDLGAEELFVHADGVRLVQVFSNLLHNAGKYTDSGGCIHVRVRREGEDACVSIRDTGAGIPSEMIEKVFDLFVQVPTSLQRAQGGLGIGLTLVRALCELHGGSIRASSEGLGRGSTFTVRLPLARSPAELPAPAPDAATPPAERPIRVLVVDDNEDAANSMADMLRLLGHHAEVAFSGLRATVMAEDVEPDLVLLDIGLPEIDGYEVARRLRRNARRRVRLVAVTGYGAESDKRRSREAGFDEHVVKPVMPETLAAIIERVRLDAGAIAGA